ncbi:6826c50f-6dfa-4ef7-b4cf-ce68c29ff078 [Thermothielavioides terrestris]|uniref:6826c50f-6dfa-4ef7-b4cf-ce68c29ff078 n=1 Tax=Thermothielavioides terrestris TaxID=2587410 RepID=A0A446BA63_9PEZI|nr:6826c50f-6dfa-4ef7-b4cf-ce68c29ff078 [Thermothielavioides terrestris]
MRPLPLAAALGRGSWWRYAAVAAAMTGAVVLYAWVDLHFSLPWNPDRPTLPSFPAAPLANACDGIGKTTSELAAVTAARAPIPNIVHYVWLLADPVVFSLGFTVFVTVYSSHLFLRPDRIYIHTDASPELWDRAKTAGDTWTKRVLNIPGVTPNFVEKPRVTSQGVGIDNLASASDFIRAEALRTYGGVYLDTDAVPLRDLAPLRHAGFASVVGGAVALLPKYTGWVNNGVWLSRPHASLAEIYLAAMDTYYDGRWAIGVDILTDLAFRLHAVPGEVLIVHPRAFAPVSWELADQTRLFKPYLGSTPSASAAPAVNGSSSSSSSADVLTGAAAAAAGEPPSRLPVTCADALAWLRDRELREQGEQGGRRRRPRDSWEMDFSATYVLHAFDGDAHRIRGWDGRITLRYVLAQQSNYARAVFPAVWHAVQAGVIPVEEAS